MTKESLYNFHRLNPFTIGFNDIFDEFEKTANQLAKAATYPPYNIRQVDENNYVIEMAVAGRSEEHTSELQSH